MMFALDITIFNNYLCEFIIKRVIFMQIDNEWSNQSCYSLSIPYWTKFTFFGAHLKS